MHIKNIIRVFFISGVLLLIPLILSQVTDEMNWDLGDYVVMGTLLVVIGLLLELIAAKVKTTKQRIIAGTILAFVFLLVWADLAVGIFNIPGFSGS